MKTLSKRSLSKSTPIPRSCALVRDRWTDEERYHRMRGSASLVVFVCLACGKRVTGLVRPNPDGRGGNLNLCYVTCRCGGEMERTDDVPKKQLACPKCGKGFRNPNAMRMHVREHG
jgi:hypothetical protein